MIERRIQIEEGARLTLIEMASDATLSGWDQADLLIRLPDGADEELTTEDTESGPAVSVRVPCEVRVPTMLPVTVRQAQGNLHVKGLADLNTEQVRGNLKLNDVHQAVIAEVYGNLKAEGVTSLRLVGTVYGEVGLKAVQSADLQNVRGNLQAKAVDRLRASRISGNLQAREVDGTLDADQVGGNASLKGVAGIVTLDQVAGNLAARNLTGGAKVARIGGNLMFNGGLGTGCTYHFRVDGNALLRLDEEASAHVTLSAKGQLLSSVALADEKRSANTLTGTLGDGGAEIVVEAGGNVLLGGARPLFQAEPGAKISQQVEESLRIGEEISRQVEDSLRAIDLEALGRQVSEGMEQAMSRLRVKMESIDWDRIGHRAQQAVERAMERMQLDMDRLAEKAARRQEKLGRKARRAAQYRQQPSVTFEVKDWETGAEAEPAGPEPSLDEERLTILKMVEQGQITSEEAEMLLDALA